MQTIFLWGLQYAKESVSQSLAHSPNKTDTVAIRRPELARARNHIVVVTVHKTT